MYLTTPLLRFTELFFLSWFAENCPKMNETFNNNFEGKQAPEGNKNKIDVGTTGDRNPC